MITMVYLLLQPFMKLLLTTRTVEELEEFDFQFLTIMKAT